MEALSPGHLIIIAVVAVVLFFGWKQLPDITRSLGRSLRIFRAEITGLSDLADDAHTLRAELADTAGEARAAVPPTADRRRPHPGPQNAHAQAHMTSAAAHDDAQRQ
jgi:sec-independent protein translocase protein TatA